MTRIRPLRPLGIAAALTIAAAAFSVAQPARADKDDFKVRMREVLEAWQTLDPSNAAPFYDKAADQVYFDFLPAKYTGWDAYASGTAQVFQGFSSLALTLNDDLWLEGEGNVRVSAITGTIEVVDKAGARQAMDFRWTAVWKKKGGDWLIAHEHHSVPMPDEGVERPGRD